MQYIALVVTALGAVLGLEAENEVIGFELNRVGWLIAALGAFWLLLVVKDKFLALDGVLLAAIGAWVGTNLHHDWWYVAAAGAGIIVHHLVVKPLLDLGVKSIMEK